MLENSINNLRDTDQIPLVIAFTPSYFVPVCTCLSSVFAHSCRKEVFHIICLLTEPLSEKMKKALFALADNQVKFSFINLAGQLPVDIYVDEKYTIAASYRLLLPNLLPRFTKVLYIDCDMIFRNDLGLLYNSVDLTGNYMAGVFEATLDFQEKHMHDIGCEPGQYINSGLLLMNLEQLRADSMVAKFLDAAKAPNLEFPDQDVINQLCKGRIIGLPPYWNSIRTFLLPPYKDAFLRHYSEADWQLVQRQGNIHYTGPKPWNTFTVAFDLWWNYYETLPLSIQDMLKLSPRLQILAKVYRTGLGKQFVEGLRKLSRMFKKE